MPPPSTLVGFVAALDAITEPTSVRGTWPAPAGIAVGLASGEARSVADPGFVDWLVAHAEVAPFGDGAQTRVDPAVRRALRLVDRGAATIAGFAIDTTEIARALAPRGRIVATLTDILVYPVGGKFARHKDTPKSPALVGTLIVALPVEHDGGVLSLDDGSERTVIDWSDVARMPGRVPWVAMFGDVDHAIAPVTAGARVTAVYALTAVHDDGAPLDALASVREALAALLADPDVLPAGGDLVIPCARHVVAPADLDAVPEIAGVRGRDRDVVDLLAGAGLSVALRPCLCALSTRSPRATERGFDGRGGVDGFVRLARPLGKRERAELGDYVTFAQRAVIEGDDDDDAAVSTLAGALLRTGRAELWATRRRAAGTMIREAQFSWDGVFGNEHFEAWIYQLVALEVPVGPPGARLAATAPAPAPAAAAPRRVRHAKFGDGTVIAETHDGKAAILEIAFDGGDTKKLVARFVTEIVSGT